MMKINTQYVAGALVGVGVAATGFYLYKKNQNKVDSYLRSHGVNIPSSCDRNYSVMSLEELVLSKEKIEDIIAEKEIIDKKLKTAKK